MSLAWVGISSSCEDSVNGSSVVRRQIPTEPAGVLANTSQAQQLQFPEQSDFYYNRPNSCRTTSFFVP